MDELGKLDRLNQLGRLDATHKKTPECWGFQSSTTRHIRQEHCFSHQLFSETFSIHSQAPGKAALGMGAVAAM
jgi:hypothetical protein